MNKKLLTEISRVREIMGLSRPLLLEQGRLITRIFKYGARTADEWWVALRKTLVDDSIYKKFEGKIPLSSVLNDADFTAVLELVLSKTPNTTKRSKKLMGPQLRGIGLDVTDDVAGKIGRETVNTAKNPAKPLVEVLEDITGETAEVIKKTEKEVIKKTTKELLTSVETKKIFSKLGKESTGDIAPLRKSLEDLISGTKNSVPIEDIQKFLKDLELPTDDVNKWIKTLKNGGDISEIADIERIFKKALGNNNYRKDLLKTIEGNPTWQKWVQEADFTPERVANMLGVESGDELAEIFYKELLNKKWFKRWVKKSLVKVLTSSVAKKIYKWIGFLSIGGLATNFFFGKEYLSGDKQKEGMSPQMYLDINTNKEMVKDEGGYTDDTAKKIAKLIYKAMDEGEYYKNKDGDYETELENISTGNMETVLVGTADEYILELYESIPTILACSQVCYWYEEEYGPGKLKSALEDGMRASNLISPYISQGLGDVVLKDVLEEIETKFWCLTCQSENTQKGYKTRIKNNWPRYQPSLTDISARTPEKYFARVKGPMDIAVLGEVLEFCNASTGKDMSSCLINVDPKDFNTAWANHYGEDIMGPPYSPNYNKDDAKDMTDYWDTQWRDLIEDRPEGEDGNSVWDDIQGREVS
jgi:hypothetical protein